MENQHKHIKGYRELSEEEIELMNRVKAMAAEVGALVDKLTATDGLDKRCVAIARTELQTGFMWAVRSIAQPTTFG
jgi:hypothetical protein